MQPTENRFGQPTVPILTQRARSEGIISFSQELLEKIFSFVKSRRDCFAAALTCRQFSVLISKERREVFPPVPPQVEIIRSERIGGFSREVLDKIFSFLKSGQDCFATMQTCGQFSSIMPHVRFDYHSLFVKSRNRNPPFIGYFKKVPLSCMSGYYPCKGITLGEEEKPSDWKYQDDRRFFNTFLGGYLRTISTPRLDEDSGLFSDDEVSDVVDLNKVFLNEGDLTIGTFRTHYNSNILSLALIEKKGESSTSKVVQIITTRGDFYHFPASPVDPTLQPSKELNIFRDTKPEEQKTNSFDPMLEDTSLTREGNPKKRSYDGVGFDVFITNPTHPKKRKLDAVINKVFLIPDTDLVLLDCLINGDEITRLWNSETLQILQEIPGSISRASPSGKLFFITDDSFSKGKCPLYKFNKDLNEYELLRLDLFRTGTPNFGGDQTRQLHFKLLYSSEPYDFEFLNDTHLFIRGPTSNIYIYNLITYEVTELLSNLFFTTKTKLESILSNMLVANHHIVFTKKSQKERVLYIQNTITGIYESFTSRMLSSKRKSHIHAFRIITREETSFVQVCLKYDHTNFGGPTYEYVEISLGPNVAIGLNKDGATLPAPQSFDIISSEGETSSSEEEEEEQLSNMPNYANADDIVPLDIDSDISHLMELLADPPLPPPSHADLLARLLNRKGEDPAD